MDRDRWVLTSAALLLTCVGVTKQPTSIRSIVGKWDMLNAGVPARGELLVGASILVGSGLVTGDGGSGLLLTQEGRELRRATRGGGMREIPSRIEQRLRERTLAETDVDIPAEVYDAAVADYLHPPRGRVGRALDSLRSRIGR